MNKSDDISLLAVALVKAQPMIDGAKKDSLNPHFKSKYADLGSVWDAVSDALSANDLAVSQFPDETSQGMPALTTMLIHKSGQWIGATYPLISVKQDPQGFASALTYARRYGLSSVLGVVGEDDDGEGASRAPKPSAAPSHPTRDENPDGQTKAWCDKEISKWAGFKRLPDLLLWQDERAPELHRLLTKSPSMHRYIMDEFAKRQSDLNK